MKPVIRKIPKKRQIQNEAFDLSSIFGDQAAAQIKKLFSPRSGMSTQDIQIRDTFVKRFVSSAQSELAAAIEGGIVDPALDDEQGSPAPATATASKPRARIDPVTGQMYPVTESRFRKLNAIFEAIILEQEQQSPSLKMSISDWLFKMWWPSFMRGTDYKDDEGIIKAAMDEIQKTYATDSGKKALQTLAMRAYVLQLMASRARQNRPKQPAAPKDASDLAKELIQLKTTNPQEFAKLVAELNKTDAKP